MKSRGNLLIVFTIIVGLIFIVKLLYLQVLTDEYKKKAERISIKKKITFPERGFIYDRSGKLLVANQTSYDVMIIPREVKPLDTLEFCSFLKINKEQFIKKYNKAKRYSPRLASVFVKQLAKEDYAYLQEKMFKFEGFYIQKRSIRDYPIKHAANVVGYIGEINRKKLNKDNYYQQGELIGINGVEKQYETYLRGKKGIKWFQKDNHNKIIDSYKNGTLDSVAKIGRDLTLTLDIDLQIYGEQLMKNKRGAIIALQPKTGEILALVTSPSYDPSLMVGRKRAKYSSLFLNDKINKPMFDRGLKGQYAPGSPFKIVNALIGLQEHVINLNTKVLCRGSYRYGKRKHAVMKCHCGTHGNVKLDRAIYNSCNSYFSNTYKQIIEKYDSPEEGMDNWSNKVKSFGLGNYLGTDLPQGDPGFIPDSKYYNKNYKFKWRAVTSISNAIGQGQVTTTPIQLANMTAAIANKGYFYTPHIVKNIKGVALDSKYTTPKKTAIDSIYFNPIIEGMFHVFKKGTAKYSQVKNIEICGKTGTVQNYIRQNGKKIALADHSIFIAFAPKDNPKIALAVFIENGGYGSQYAAPITSLMIEKYINGKTFKPYIENRMMNDTLLLKEYRKIINPIKN